MGRAGWPSHRMYSIEFQNVMFWKVTTKQVAADGVSAVSEERESLKLRCLLQSHPCFFNNSF